MVTPGHCSNGHDTARCMLLMVFWRCWFIRNEVVHNKPPSPVEVSIRFLRSYLDSLIGIKLNSSIDQTKGKMSISYMAPISHVAKMPLQLPWAPPKPGSVKLNLDGSMGQDGAAGAGMILRNEIGEIFFSACIHLHVCRVRLEGITQPSTLPQEAAVDLPRQIRRQDRR